MAQNLGSPDVKGALQTQRDERAKLNEAAMKRMDESKPTPTQEENDLAKLGVLVDQKEDDGSGKTVITTVTVANEPLPPVGAQPKAPEDRPQATPQREATPGATPAPKSKKEW
jgi:hypothetical protein